MAHYASVTLGHIRSHGCRDLLVYCNSGRCHHSTTMNADHLPDETLIRSLGRKMVCTRCGHVGADVRPDWGPHVNRRLAVGSAVVARQPVLPERKKAVNAGETNYQLGNSGQIIYPGGGVLMAEISPRPIVPGGRLRVGSHIKVPRVGYYHHGIYVGRRRVIHYAGLSTARIKSGPIVRTSLAEFAAESEIQVVKYEKPLSRDEIISRAESRVGEDKYHPLRNNCEHFATWCATGNSSSKQVQAFVLGGFLWLQAHHLIDW